MTPPALHPAATEFDRVGGLYERGRPEYPDASVTWLVARLGLHPGRRALDVAAGTGKLTDPLCRSGADVVAVEPVAGMHRVLRARLPTVPVVAALAQALALRDGSVDALTVAQALHWFAGPEAFGELWRVLRPGGALGVVWNRRDLDDPLQAEITRVVAGARGDTPEHADGSWRRAIGAFAGFGPPEEHHHPWIQPASVDDVTDRMASVSFVAGLPDGRRRQLLGDVAAAARAAEAAGVCHLAYVTDTYVFPRRP